MKMLEWLDHHLPWKTLCLAMVVLNVAEVWFEVRVGHGVPLVNVFVAVLCLVSFFALLTAGK